MKMLRTTQDIRLLGPWGSPQFLRAGSVITRRSNFDVYGIDIDSFSANYVLCDQRDELVNNQNHSSENSHSNPSQFK